MNAAKQLRDLEAALNDRREEVRRAKVANTALQWLEQYGQTAADWPSFAITISPSFATVCVGYNEAVQHLGRAAGDLRQAILDTALANARADLARALTASADRSPEGGNPEEGCHAKHESAVGEAETPTPQGPAITQGDEQ
jgi:hypothetical protein